MSRWIDATTDLKTLDALRASLAARAGVGADSRTALEAVEEVIRLRKRAGEGIGGGHRRITLCGSQRFAAQFDVWHARLTLVERAMVHTAPRVDGELSAHEKDIIDDIWFAMIETSDEVFVLDVDGYIGASTAEEIAFARERGVPVRLLSDVEASDG